MKYEKAKEVLPDELLREVQKYAAGRLLYIPCVEEKKTGGESSGCRMKLKIRNQMICRQFSDGKTISELSEEHFLSMESIKKIVYSKKREKIRIFQPSLASAKEYADAGMAEEWIHSYLLLIQRNEYLSQKLLLINRYYIGPVKVPLRLVTGNEHNKSVNCFPEEMNSELNQFDNRTKLYHSDLESGADLPPLLVHFSEGRFALDEDPYLLLALQQLKVNAYPMFVWMTKTEDYDQFMKQYGVLCYELSESSRKE